MRKMPFVILASSALVGLAAACYMTHTAKSRPPKLPPNVFVSADQHGLVELPEEPKPMPAEPPLMPILLQPEPMPTPGDGREVTVSARQPEEEESIPTVSVIIASPEEAPPSPELIAMPTEETASEVMTLPSGHYHQERPHYVPQSQAFPLSHELPTMEAVNENRVPPPIPAPAPTPVPTVPVQVAPAQSGALPLPATVFTVSRPRVSAHSELLPLTGTHPCSLENKVELTLPDTVRQQMVKAPHVLYMAPAPDQKCVWIYTSAGVEQLAGRMAYSNRRILLSRLQYVIANSDGVFKLPVELAEAANLGKDAILIGVRDHFELWDAKKWQEYSEGKEYESRPIWLTDQPSHLTPEQMHGGIQ